MLGIAESFHKEKRKSILVGVVQRADGIIDGFNISFPTVGGLDATDKIIEIYEGLNRRDINVVAVSGVVISWFNVIDLNRVFEKINKPLISITYEESQGLLQHFKRAFPNDWKTRWEIHVRNGERVKICLRTGYEIFIRPLGLNVDEAVKVLNRFIIEGKYPEPIRVAYLIAHGLSRRFEDFM